jgi:hypothetical protein
MSVQKVLSRETVKVVETFTNGFAQKVIKLENGLQLYINFSETEAELVTVDPRELEAHEVASIINNTEEE